VTFPPTTASMRRPPSGAFDERLPRAAHGELEQTVGRSGRRCCFASGSRIVADALRGSMCLDLRTVRAMQQSAARGATTGCRPKQRSALAGFQQAARTARAGPSRRQAIVAPPTAPGLHVIVLCDGEIAVSVNSSSPARVEFVMTVIGADLAFGAQGSAALIKLSDGCRIELSVMGLLRRQNGLYYDVWQEKAAGFSCWSVCSTTPTA
jgi:hypothetical protein